MAVLRIVLLVLLSAPALLRGAGAVVSPYEILGVPPNAAQQVVDEAVVTKLAETLRGGRVTEASLRILQAYLQVQGTDRAQHDAMATQGGPLSDQEFLRYLNQYLRVVQSWGATKPLQLNPAELRRLWRSWAEEAFRTTQRKEMGGVSRSSGERMAMGLAVGVMAPWLLGPRLAPQQEALLFMGSIVAGIFVSAPLFLAGVLARDLSNPALVRAWAYERWGAEVLPLLQAGPGSEKVGPFARSLAVFHRVLWRRPFWTALVTSGVVGCATRLLFTP